MRTLPLMLSSVTAASAVLMACALSQDDEDDDERLAELRRQLLQAHEVAEKARESIAETIRYVEELRFPLAASTRLERDRDTR